MTIYDFLLIVIVTILCFTVMHIWKLLTDALKWIGDNMNIKDTQIKLLQQKIERQEETIARFEKMLKNRDKITDVLQEQSKTYINILNTQNERIKNQDETANSLQSEIHILQEEITLLEEQLTAMNEKIKNDELIIKTLPEFLEKCFKKETEE
ncbi:MAG: hypothetical protein IIT39_01300 [Clostridia bacterium]|nr:hypothetical protein [Clostridia bacterium]